MKDRIGEKYLTNQGYWVTIIEYFGCYNCTIKFEDGTVRRNVAYKEVKNGSIVNPLHKSVCGVGYLGVGKYSPSINKQKTKEYSYWHDMINRCYNTTRKNGNKHYKPVNVDEEWHCFQAYAEWFNKNYVNGWHVDKDILVKGNKIYSPSTCCFVPQEINSIFTRGEDRRGLYPIGVTKVCSSYKVQLNMYGEIKYIGTYKTIEEAFQAYKTAKEEYIKEVADKWKPLITPEVYQAMYNYQVEITD